MKFHRSFFLIVCAVVTALSAATAVAQDEGEPAIGDRVTITTSAGHTIEGVIVAMDSKSITVRDDRGIEYRLPRSEIDEMVPAEGGSSKKLLWREDPNYSRLLYAPTGRPLKRGDGYFSDHYLFLVGLGVGVTNHFSLLAGMSILPAVSPGDQVFYVAPRIGGYVNDKLSLSAGTIFFNVNSNSGGLLFGVATLGAVSGSVTVGLGFGYHKGEDDTEFEFSSDPVIVLGANARLSNSVALIGEGWFLTNDDVSSDEQPVAVALRFFGDRMATDFGFVLIGAVLEEGFPIPWLGFTYNFGQS